jgi:uncharacterized membrane protein YuzA (DUF378 family)
MIGTEGYSMYMSVKLNMLLTLLVLVGAINWGTTAFGYNLVEMLSNTINNFFKSDVSIDKAIYIVVAISALLLAMKRETWLPFLGKTVFPPGLVNVKVPEKTNKKIQIKTKPNSKVVYWAARGNNAKQDVWVGYGDFTNGGVVMSDANGNAELAIEEGAGYIVPSGRQISRHIHYRVFKKNGLLGKVKTVFY